MAENRPFLDFKAIKGRVAIADVLPRYHVNLVRVNQTSLKGNCPLPSHSSGSKNTFFVNVAKSVWYCHSDSCKKNGDRAGGNVIDFVAARRGYRIRLIRPAPAVLLGASCRRRSFRVVMTVCGK